MAGRLAEKLPQGKAVSNATKKSVDLGVVLEKRRVFRGRDNSLHLPQVAISVGGWGYGQPMEIAKRKGKKGEGIALRKP